MASGRCVPTRYIRDNDEFAERGTEGEEEALMERRTDTLSRSPEWNISRPRSFFLQATRAAA